jgi:hypothetical protein
MTPIDRKAFLETVVGFAELKGKQLSAPALELYWRSLQHWDLPDFRAAAEQLLRTCEFMPLPKDFEDLRKAGRLTAGEAWAEVLRCARKGYDLPDDELTRRAVNAIGGIRTVMMSDVDKTPFLERRFAEHFESIQESMDTREAVPQIAFDRRGITGPTSAANLLGRLFPGPGE